MYKFLVYNGSFEIIKSLGVNLIKGFSDSTLPVKTNIMVPGWYCMVYICVWNAV